ncbi:unnamed protein product [Mucor hiemalis]
MSFLGGGSADCGPVNPMAGLMKQFGQDKSLQQDRFGLDQRGESSKAGFRTRQTGPVPADRQVINELKKSALELLMTLYIMSYNG